MQELQKVHGNEITFMLVPKFFQIYAWVSHDMHAFLLKFLETPCPTLMAVTCNAEN